MPVIESRYAEAFLSAIKSPETADDVESKLSGLSEVWRGSDELKFFMLNPVVPDAAKKDTIAQILSLGEKADPVLKNFIFLFYSRSFTGSPE